MATIILIFIITLLHVLVVSCVNVMNSNSLSKSFVNVHSYDSNKFLLFLHAYHHIDSMLWCYIVLLCCA